MKAYCILLLFPAVLAVSTDWGLLFEDIQTEDVEDALLNILSDDGFSVYESLAEEWSTDRFNDSSDRNCNLCRTGTTFVNTNLRLGLEYWDVRDVIISACELLFINSTTKYDQMCEGMMDNYVSHYWYILDTRRMTALEACRGVHFCEPELEEPEYIPRKRNIPTQNTPDKPMKKHINRDDALKVVHLSDIHVDHEYATGAPTDCGLYLCCREKYPGGGSARAWGDYTCNLPVRTLRLFLEHVADLDTDMVLYTGDTPPHHMWEETLESQLNYSRGLTEVLTDILPGIPMYTSLGNHETFPTNLYYMNRTDIQVLNSKMGEWWSDLSGFGDDQLETLQDGGYYSIVQREGLRIISYNSLYRYANNFYSLISGDHPAYLQMQAFLRDTLQEAREQNEKVILLGHIPPGRSTTVDFGDWFQALVLEYAELIVLNLYGHTHRDFFTLFMDEEGLAQSVQFVTPSVTSLTDRNPTARVYWLDPETYQLLDYDHYWLDIEQTTEDESTTPTIRLSYNPLSDYGMEDLSVDSWQLLAQRLETDDNLLSEYYQNYQTRRAEPNSCDEGCRRARLCEINHVNYEHVLMCNKGWI